MFNIFINYSNTGITGQYQMSSAKEMRFMQIYSEKEKKSKRVREINVSIFDVKLFQRNQDMVSYLCKKKALYTMNYLLLYQKHS